MKKFLYIGTLLALAPLSAGAESPDLIGGPAGAQTIHHCGFLPTSPGRYTHSPITTTIVEKKLSALGYSKRGADGSYGKSDKAAVKAFQADMGIQVDGIVGPITARHLAYATHPSTNVRRCYRAANITR